MKKEIIEIEVKGTGEGIKQVEKLTGAIEDTGDASKKTATQVEDVGKSGEKSKKGLKAVSVGLKGIGTALKVAGIGLIIGLFASLASIMSENQKVMDVINTVTTALSLTFNAITSALSNAWQSAKDVTGGFDAMKKVIGGLITLAITPLKLAFFAIKSAIISAQLGWEQSFLGKGRPEKIKELTDSLKEVKDDIKRIGEEALQAGKDIVVNFVEAVKEVGSLAKATVSEVSKISLKSIIDQSKAMVELKNNALLAVAQQSLLIEKFDIQAEKLRQIRDEERNSIDDRIKANDDLKEVLDSQEKSMISLANLQVQAAEADIIRNDTIENQVALIDALANRQGILAQIEGFRSEQLINDLGLAKEQIELNKALSESESKLFIERKRFNAEQIEDEKSRLLALQEIDVLEQERETIRLQAIIDFANAGTQAKIDAQILLDEFLEQSRQKNILSAKAIAKTEIKLDKDKVKSKSDTLDSIANLAGAESKIGKALLIVKQFLALKESILDAKKTVEKAVQTGIRSALAITEGTAQTAKIGFPQNIPMLIGYAIQSASIISAIKSAMSKAKSSASISGVGANVATQSISPNAFQTSNFNLKGDSLANAIGNQSQVPVRAFVVSKEMTTQQEFDRNVEDAASLG